MPDDSWELTAGVLPDCCRQVPLRLVPGVVHCDLLTNRQQDGYFEFGIDTWRVRTWASWDSEDAYLEDTLTAHVGRDVAYGDVVHVAADHGLRLDAADEDRWCASVGELVAHAVTFEDPYAAAAERGVIADGADLLAAVDDAARELVDVVSVVADPTGERLFNTEVLNRYPDAEFADRLLVLSTIRVTPALRGNLLGAWAAAQLIGAIPTAGTLVVTKAAPINWSDVIAGGIDGPATPTQDAAWTAEQERLAAHWSTHLGFTPMMSDPNVLIWHSSYVNDALLDLHRLHA